MRLFFLLTLSIIISHSSFAQGVAEVYGLVKGSDAEVLPQAHIKLRYQNEVLIQTISDNDGRYSVKAPLNKELELVVHFIGYDTLVQRINFEGIGRYKVNLTLKQASVQLDAAVISGEKVVSAVFIDSREIENQVGPTPSVENILKTSGKVTSNNELSSSYSVRGGSFDENLVYLNDFEIYRPQLASSGAQEGLSILNSDLISNIQFFAGGFSANYGDKMSSALDVQLKDPKSFSGKASLGLLGGSLSLEGRSEDARFSYLFGARNQRNSYLLNSLDVSGSYRPVFYDVQSYLSYKMSDKTKLSLLTYVADNVYLNIPRTQTTRLGNVKDAKVFTVAFEGQEKFEFRTYMGGLKLEHFNEEKGDTWKWLVSAYSSNESQNYDVNAGYRINDLESNLGADDFGETLPGDIGVGRFHNYGRNSLDIIVASTETKNTHIRGKHTIKWGLKYQREIINDKLYEWTLIDSAGYAVPYSSSDIIMDRFLQGTSSLSSDRFMAYVQDEFRTNFKDSSSFAVNYGIRTSYWSLNDQRTLSPRMQLYYKPNWGKNYTFRAAIGVYHQPPFYRELRGLDGVVNRNVLAQRANHYTFGVDYEFSMWDRPFKLSSEVYFKALSNLNPYEVDNVRVNYYANNNAKGYAFGTDFRVNGEFVKGTESWFALSLMQAKEDILDDQFTTYVDDTGAVVNTYLDGMENVSDSFVTYPGYIPRPTDQLLTFNIFFQDYVRDNENIKVHLNFILGTGFKFGPPDNNRYKDTLRLPMYRRIDLGFSGLLVDGENPKYGGKGLGKIKSLWGTLEIFNLIDVPNTVSYLWIRDINARLYAVPNHLTRRLLNFKLVAKF